MKTIHLFDWPEGYLWQQQKDKEEYSSKEDKKEENEDLLAFQNFLSFFTGKTTPPSIKKEENETITDLTTEKELKCQELQFELLKELFNNALKEDNSFHYFFEPEIIIRMNCNGQPYETVKEILKNKNIGFVEYDYPNPLQEHLTVKDRNQNERKLSCYGETKGGIVLKYFDMFTNIFHYHSVAAISMDKTDHFEYMERVIHTMFNPRSYTRDEEGKHLTRLAIYKSGVQGVDKHLQNFDPWNI
ncbi:hypothetical protein ABK040_008974 [Willaertia magna]